MLTTRHSLHSFVSPSSDYFKIIRAFYCSNIACDLTLKAVAQWAQSTWVFLVFLSSYSLPLFLSHLYALISCRLCVHHINNSCNRHFYILYIYHIVASIVANLLYDSIWNFSQTMYKTSSIGCLAFEFDLLTHMRHLHAGQTGSLISFVYILVAPLSAPSPLH